MKSILLKELKLTRKGLFIWGAVVLLTLGFGMAEYPMVSQNGDAIMESMEMMPRIVNIMFGLEGVSLETSLDYHLIMYYWVSLIAFVHAVSVGVTMLSRDQRDKTSEYIYTKPYTRNTIITAKILVGVFNVVVMTVVIWIGSVATLIFIERTAAVQINGSSVLGLITMTIIGLLFTQLVFFTIGLFYAAFLKTSKKALGSAFMFILATYIISVIIEYVGSINYLNFLSPFRYFNALGVVSNGISLIYVLISIIVAMISICLTYNLYNKRDLLI